jgi:hypothetical protein
MNQTFTHCFHVVDQITPGTRGFWFIRTDFGSRDAFACNLPLACSGMIGQVTIEPRQPNTTSAPKMKSEPLALP